MVTIELTVPWEENCEEAHERKSLKYIDLMADCRIKDGACGISCRGRLQRVSSAIRVEAAHTIRDVRKNTQDNNKKTGRISRTVILLDMAPPRRSVLEVGIRRLVDWPPVLTRQLEDIMV